MLTLEVLERLWPRGDSKIPGLRKAIADQAPAVFAKHGLDSDDVVAIFMGQVSEECGGGTEVVENLRYSAKRLMAVWPRRFPTLASALPYANNPEKLAEKVYAGRMGNVPGSGHAFKYIGRGGSQTTGHDGYAALAHESGLDLLSSPELVNDTRFFLETAVMDFIKCGCLPFAKRGDIDGVTHHLNGGYTGLASRKAWTTRFRAAMTVAPAKPVEDGVLRVGAEGFDVEAVQKRMVELGYTVGSQDGKFGRETRVAVAAFQLDRGLPATGEVDQATRDALKRDLDRPISEERANATADDLHKAGSQTVAKAKDLSWWGKIAAGLGIGGGTAQNTGALDKVKDVTDQVSTLRDVIDSASSAAHWALSYWWVLLIIAGFFAVKYGGAIISQRLADHRAGANLRL